jgi:circadian clock protein KaiC
MANTIRKIPSGFSFIDNNWGGMYRGGSYLVVGPRKSGRTLIGLQMALEAAKSSEICLYFTLMRPKDLMIQAASLNFDIQSYMNQNLIIVVRVAPPNDINDLYNPDEYLVEYLNDIVTVVDQYHPARIVFDELTPFVGFKNLEYLKDSFVKTLESIEERDITSMFIISEPATQKAQSIVDGLAEFVTAVVHLKKEKNPSGERSQNGVVLISPNVGHNEGQFSASYRIEPYKGVTTDFTPLTHITEEFAPLMHGINDYNQITRVEIPSEPYAYSNVYNYTDFLLILNNQIALFKSTGQTFNLISFKLDTAAQIRGLLSLNQLQLAVRLAVSKKDKICIIDNKVIVLLVRGNLKSVIDLMTNVQNNLPSRESDYVNAVMEFISIFNMEVNEKIENAENMMENVMSTENSQSKAYQPLNKYIG